MEEITNAMQVTKFETLGALNALVIGERIGERAPLRGISDVTGCARNPDSDLNFSSAYLYYPRSRSAENRP